MRKISYAVALHGQEEFDAVADVLNKHETIMGKRTAKFEERVAALFGKKHGIAVNSGSSAILLALEMLDLPEGSEVITPVMTFSTTVAPIIQKRLTPVFVDAEEGTYQVNIDQIEEMITDKTKVLLIPSLVGNVPDYPRLQKIAKQHHLVLIEDSCDCLGATIQGQPTGTFTDISITSFYGSHIITAGGNGGMIAVNNDDWARKLRVLRGWGRSSAADENESLADRMNYDLDGEQHDSKFIFERVAYNMLPNEMCSAFGLAQLDKLPTFTATRNRNWTAFYEFFKPYEKWFILPKQREDVKTAWLAFAITVREDAPFKRQDLVMHLEENGVQTRPVWAGNILRHPGFKDIAGVRRPDYPAGNAMLRRAFLFGANHGMTQEDVQYIQDLFTGFFKSKSL